MLKTFWRYLWGEPDPDTSLEILRIIVENQEKTQAAVMNAVNSMAQASDKQAEVLSSYLKLFNGAGDPTSWKEDETKEAENKASLTEMGLDLSWDEAKQAEWVLANIDKL